MAGTPTTNYSIPTYADTDAPDLSGAYNDAMDIIDTQLKANADAIESASTGNYTGTNPITVDNGQRTISVGTATPGGDGATSGLGVVRVSGKSSDIGTEAEINGSTVPNAKAVADYVQSKMAAAGAAYTGTAPIVVDNGSHAISINSAKQLLNNNYESFLTQIQASADNYRGFIGASYPVVEGVDVANSIWAAHDVTHNWPAALCVPNLNAVMGLIIQNQIKDKNGATQQLTVGMLKNLWVNPNTGSVFYKAPTE